MSDDYELPRAVVTRLLKSSIQKEAKEAITKAAKIWILYATACANDFCQNSNRSTISANDVLMAMEELEFPDFVPQLKETLETFKKDQASKKAAKKN
ncbi:CCAATbox binding transcription factor subunit HAP3-related, putative [Acanthamoeba castellanii str. Neff]|uniref:CCAATbox binding transcription factor subunit HAP3-related, putative n=1 Tax=Acanthamoeba castellanii (strain ATCC 30010 / Neff) TaxID=1257118 RepID=L8GNY5_ACACF|nr:CCAATbox binding transcription factor subunit HAP3-related, putative [Acanthamoeba castellanii str. Neff]ELR14904.1 CCAATbox binding transcription factor subunit HAP3-related, putative [Acanthamoeba castellanii str. Neff]